MTTELNVDAFDTEADDAAVRALEDASGASSGEALGFQRLELAATLQDAKVSAAQNGHNYDVKYEVDIEGFVRLALEAAKGKGGFDMTWNQTAVGTGAEIKSLGSTRDADGEMHYRVVFHLPQSEIHKSLGRVGSKLGARAKLVLEPMQGELGLADGTKVDLTAKA